MLNESTATPTIGVKNLLEARKFYEDKLGFVAMGKNGDQDVQLYRSGQGVLEIYKSDFAGTNKSTAVTWSVGSAIEDEVKALRDKGIEFEHYQLPDSHLEGDIHVMPEMKAAWFKDPDGNILCIHDQ